MPGLLDLFALYFGLMFTLYLRPWSARDPQSAAHVGIGAFNMIRATAYRAAGGHMPIRLRPDDDLKLGKPLKQAGFRQDFVAGRGLVAVDWYAAWRQVRDGLMKNLFAGTEYRTWNTAPGWSCSLSSSMSPCSRCPRSHCCGRAGRHGGSISAASRCTPGWESVPRAASAPPGGPVRCSRALRSSGLTCWCAPRHRLAGHALSAGGAARERRVRPLQG